MDATLQRLETDLLQRWGREEMTVYADYLQSIGDPRGEVVALDLVNLDTVDPADWKTRREEAIVDWLGEELATYLGGNLFQGFIQESSDARVLASPAGEFVRASRVGIDRDAIDRLAQRTRPWLVHLAITGIAAAPPAIPNTLVDKLVRATPRLEELVLRGAGIMDRFKHPNVRHVRIEGEALTTLRWGGEWLSPPPAFAIERVRPASETADSRLYLSTTSGWTKMLAEPAIKNHITHLRVGANEEVVSVMRAAAALPRLAVIEVPGQAFEAVRAAAARERPAISVVALDAR